MVNDQGDMKMKNDVSLEKSNNGKNLEKIQAKNQVCEGEIQKKGGKGSENDEDFENKEGTETQKQDQNQDIQQQQQQPIPKSDEGGILDPTPDLKESKVENEDPENEKGEGSGKNV